MPDILRKATTVPRETFDPTNPLHIESFKHFVRTGNWGDVQFFTELPYIEVPMTVLMKFAMHALQVERESTDEKTKRLAGKNLIQFPKPETAEDKAARRQAANALLKEWRAA